MKIGFINTALNEDAAPINLVYLATALKLAGVSEVKIIDHTFSKGDLGKQIHGLDCVGISAMTRYYNEARAIAAKLKKITDIPVIIGGSHITTVPDSLSGEFDLGVIGEGERTIVELCRLLRSDGSFLPESLKQVPGIVYRHAGKLLKTPQMPLVSELDDIAMPDFNFLDRNYFKRKWIIWSGKNGRSMKIMTSRGCPYHCIFCASQKIWKTVRLHSAERIFREVKTLFDLWGVDHIYIDDDLFIIDKTRLEKFGALMEKEGLNGKIAFFCSVRSNLLDDRTCLVLKKIGAKVLNFGFESGSDRLLKRLKGGDISVATHKNAIALCNSHGLAVWGSFMMGSPGETIADMEETAQFIEYAVKNGCKRLGLFVASPLPGTEFWEIAFNRGSVSMEMNWDLIDYANSARPLLLDPDVDQGRFRKIFNALTAKADRLMFKDAGWQAIILRSRKAVGKLLAEPKRAVNLLSPFRKISDF